MAQMKSRQRLRQDVGYVLYGFVGSLLVIWAALLAIAGLVLIAMALLPGSIGDTLRELLPPGRLMQLMALGAGGEILALWGLSAAGMMARPLSLRLRWILGGWVLGAIALAAVLSLGR